MVSVIDTKTDAVVASISVRPGAGAPIGSSPNALAMSPDGKTLYVANGANNALAVVDVAANPPRVAGFIPTGWFPAAVAAAQSGKAVWVASGYGFGSIAPTADGRSGRSYKDRAGIVSLIDFARGGATCSLLAAGGSQQSPAGLRRKARG